jgi:class 3 adenylate cyclase/pimeloyl-ACP methyl ester carboxylesterase
MMRPVREPETRYAKASDGAHIAYQVVGEGPVDFVNVTPSWTSDLEYGWEFEFTADWWSWMRSRGRLVLIDRRGTGLSDPLTGGGLPTLDASMEDIRTVMDAVGIERAILVGGEDGAAHCLLFAATYPTRTAALILVAPTPCGHWAPEATWAWTDDQQQEWLEKIEAGFGSFEFFRDVTALVWPWKAGDEAFTRAYGRMVRHSVSPSAAIAVDQMSYETDVRDVLPQVQAPTLVIHFTGDQVVPIGGGRYLASHIPGAILVEQPGNEDAWWPGSPPSAGIDVAVDRFLASLKDEEAEFDRVLATVMFTDIVRSTERAVQVGDHAWRDLLGRHHAVVRAMIGRYRGREVVTAGDGFLATFDGPARAIRCARAITEAVHPLGLEVRAGVHTGEIETVGDDVRGIAVHIGARVAALAGPSQVLVSQTVKDLVAGSGLVFEDAGEHALKGVPDPWRLYRVLNAA